MISFGSRFKPIVGLDISTTGIKAVELKPAGKQWRLHRSGFKPLPVDTVVDSQIKDFETVTQAIQELFREAKISTKLVATAVSGSAVIIKKIQLPIMPELELEDQIPLEAEEYIPYDIEDVNLDFQILGQDQESMEVILVACKKELINNRLEAIEAAGLKAKVFDLDVFCIGNGYQSLLRPPGKQDPGETVALVNVGAALININILSGGRPTFTRDHLFGGRQLTEDIQRHYNCTQEQAGRIQEGLEVPDDYHYAVLNPFLDQLGLQIGQSLDFYQAGNPDRPVQNLFLSGGCALIPGIADYLGSRTGLPVEVADPLSRLKGGESAPHMQSMSPRLLVAMGLALRGMDQ